MNINAEDEMMTEKEVAAYLKMSTSALRKWRGKKVGPPFKIILGSVRYSKKALKKFLADQDVLMAG